MDIKEKNAQENGANTVDDTITKYRTKAPTEEKTAEGAAETDDVTEITVTDEDENEEDYVVEFSKNYKFEGKIINSVDLSEIEDLSGRDAKIIDKTYKKVAKGNISVQPELTNEYAIAAASFITHLPIEFFEQLNLKDIIKIRNRVINFTFGE